jgi:hypothetical protein
MTILQMQSRVGPDGVLVLSVPVGAENANREVKVIVDSIDEPKTGPKMTQAEWQQFVRSTAGSIDDPTFVRPDQGQLQDRGEMFP